MSYHIEGNGRFKNLPERILVREDGYMAAYKFDGEPIVDYRYVPEADNEKLRELAMETMRLMQTNGPDCGLCKHYDECWAGDAMNYSPSGCVICNEARELGIEVPE